MEGMDNVLVITNYEASLTASIVFFPPLEVLYQIFHFEEAKVEITKIAYMLYGVRELPQLCNCKLYTFLLLF